MSPRISWLPVLVISVQSRCNCRCAMCDFWRSTDDRRFTAADLENRLDDLRTLGVEWVVFTGGEPLMNPDLFPMAAMLRAEGIRVTLLSSGLLLRRFAAQIVHSINDVIVSLDGPPVVHDRIRGVAGAFDQMAAGIRALRSAWPRFPVAARSTVQRGNHDVLVETARAGESLGLDSISFLPVDVSSTAFDHGPGKLPVLARTLALTGEEIDTFESQVNALAVDPVFRLVAESREKLYRIVAYFRALAAGTEPVSPRCNAPWVSAVLGQDGSVRPCFFHAPLGDVNGASLVQVLNSPQAIAFRENLDIASNPVCRRCVCSLYRPAAQETLWVTA